ncbi:MAG: acyl carrier protein [Rhodobacteraceae bacterium]|nr:acyl carrier protein [Paracoccaceae bacterium]
MSVKDKVIEIIAAQAMVEPRDITLEHTLEDLGIDSVGIVESLFVIEESFDISVPFNANTPEQSDFDVSSVARIIIGVEKLVAQQHSSRGA